MRLKNGQTSGFFGLLIFRCFVSTRFTFVRTTIRFLVGGKILQLLFIVTYGRSGSTFLMHVLNSFKGVCIRGENYGASISLVDSIIKLDASIREFGSEDPESSDPWYGADSINLTKYRSNVLTSFLNNVVRPPEACKIAGFKEIRYLPPHIDHDTLMQHLDIWMSNYPEMKLLFNTRDWNAVSKSAWWAKRKKSDVKALIQSTDQTFRNLNERYGERSYLIDYSKYNGKPDGLRPVIEWLGLDATEVDLSKISSVRLTHAKQMSQTRWQKIIQRITNKLRKFTD